MIIKQVLCFNFILNLEIYWAELDTLLSRLTWLKIDLISH